MQNITGNIVSWVLGNVMHGADKIFVDIGVIIIVATIFALIARLTKQPLVPAYVLTGFLIGPVLHLVTEREVITTLSEIGIAFLLFIVGMEIDLRKLKDVGIVSSLGGVIQSISLFSIGFILAMMAGFIQIEAIYLGLIIAFSSTMVVIKILSDKKELDTLHGRIILGFLLMEDFMAIFAISLLGSLGSLSFGIILILIAEAAALFIVTYLANKFVFPKLFKFAAGSHELLFLTSISTCFLFALMFAGMQFSITIGAFVAGVTLANLPYSYEMIGRVKSIRDFFSTIFFVSLGTMIIGISNQNIILLVALLAVIWIVKPFITVFIVTFFGYKKRPAFLTAASLAQTSEFSLIIATQGLISGNLDQSIFSIAVLLAVITMSSTSYIVKYEYKIYTLIKGFLSRFDIFTRNGTNSLEFKPKSQRYDVLLVGYDRIGYSIVKKLHILRKKLLVVDFNPEIIRRLIKQNIHCIYGDIGDTEILERINLKKIAMAISTSPNKKDNELLINRTKKINKKAIVFVTAYKVEDALYLYDAGADYVILPHFLGGDHVSALIEKFGNDIDQLIQHKYGHIEELKNRQNLGHDRPIHPHNNED